MSLVYTEYNGTTTHTMETEPGTVGGEKRNVHGLAPAIVTKFTDMVTYLTAIATSVAGTLTVGLPSGASTSAKQDTGNTSLASIVSGLSSLATSALQSTANTTLSSILSALNPSTFVSGQTSVSNTDTTLSTQSCTIGAWVKNISTSSQLVYVRATSVTTSNGYQLAVGEERFFPCRNVNELHAIASATGANVSWEAI